MPCVFEMCHAAKDKWKQTNKHPHSKDSVVVVDLMVDVVDHSKQI